MEASSDEFIAKVTANVRNELLQKLKNKEIGKDDIKEETANLIDKNINNPNYNIEYVCTTPRNTMYAKRIIKSRLDRELIEVSEINKAHRLHIAARLEPLLNEYLATLPSETLEQKKEICSKVEEILEPLGLAVEIPREPFLPGRLKATTGHWPGKGRFHFEVTVDGKLKKPVVSDSLPKLKLIDSTPPHRSQSTAESPDEDAKWQNSVSVKTKGKGPKID